MNKIVTAGLARNKFLFSSTKVTGSSYSEEGEDIIVSKFFRREYKGFYVDIGNFDKKTSNTFLFYKNGWRGLNIYCKPFDNSVTPIRTRDINIYRIIDIQSHAQIIRTFNESKMPVDDLTISLNTPPLKTIKIEASPLHTILKSNLPPRNGFLSDYVDIDILNIDTTGNELNILLSNNWKIFRPKIVLVTDTNNGGKFNPDSPVYQNLWSNDYVFFAKTSKTLIFREKHFQNK